MNNISERFEVTWSLVNRELNSVLHQVRDSALSPLQWAVLNFIWTSDFVTVGQIARFTSGSKSSATTMINRLVKLGYVERNYELGDRRNISLKVTADGYEAMAKDSSGRRRTIESYLNKITSEKQIKLVKLLEELSQINNGK